MKRLISIALSTLITLGGCTSVADMVGYDSTTLNQKAAQSYVQMVQQAQSKHLVDTTSTTARRVHTVFNRLVPYANQANRTGVPFNWQLTVLKSDEMNAFAMPGGKMVVYTGLVDKLHLTDPEIAAVVGHEMTHALLEHSKKAVGQQVLTGLAANIGGAVLQSTTGMSSDAVGISTDLLGHLGVNMPFSRSQEREADAGGVLLMARAGYNPQAAINVWEKMNKLQDNNSTAEAILSDHPTNNARINAIRAIMPEVMPIYQRSQH